MKVAHIMSNFFLNHMVSETAKTFGKSHYDQQEEGSERIEVDEQWAKRQCARYSGLGQALRPAPQVPRAIAEVMTARSSLMGVVRSGASATLPRYY